MSVSYTHLDVYKRQDPESIDDYLAVGGYAALAQTLTNMSPEDVIEEIKLWLTGAWRGWVRHRD